MASDIAMRGLVGARRLHDRRVARRRRVTQMLKAWAHTVEDFLRDRRSFAADAEGVRQPDSGSVLLSETASCYLVTVEVPEAAGPTVEVSVRDGAATIFALVLQPRSTGSEGARTREYRAISRDVDLPSDIALGDVSVSIARGFVTIGAPKATLH